MEVPLLPCMSVTCTGAAPLYKTRIGYNSVTVAIGQNYWDNYGLILGMGEEFFPSSKCSD